MTRQNALLFALALVLFTGPGCSTGIGTSSPYSAGPGDMISTGWRNHVWANRAYETTIGTSGEDRMYGNDFQSGFVAGYKSICKGGDGNIPAVPPRQYWGSRYLSPEGQAKSKAWFEGYPEGIKAAQTDGIDAYRDVYVSQMIDDMNKNLGGLGPQVGEHMRGTAMPGQPSPVGNEAPPVPMPTSQKQSALLDSQVQATTPAKGNAAGMPIPILSNLNLIGTRTEASKSNGKVPVIRGSDLN